MKIPKRVKIANIYYDVVMCKNKGDVDINKDDILWGQADFSSRQIRLYSGLNEHDMEHVFLHECIHAIHSHFEIDWAKYNDEQITNLLTIGIHGLIKDNKLTFNRV